MASVLLEPSPARSIGHRCIVEGMWLGRPERFEVCLYSQYFLLVSGMATFAYGKVDLGNLNDADKVLAEGTFIIGTGPWLEAEVNFPCRRAFCRIMRDEATRPQHFSQPSAFQFDTPPTHIKTPIIGRSIISRYMFELVQAIGKYFRRFKQAGEFVFLGRFI